MKQIIVTLADDADTEFLRKMIENMKGVNTTTMPNSLGVSECESSDWLESLHDIKKSIDPSVIDLSDPRTKYITKITD